MEETRSSSPSSPSSERMDESPNETLSSSSTLSRSEPPSSYINPTAILQASQLLAHLGQRSELPIERTQLNGWQPQNPIAMLGSSSPFRAREEQLREMLTQAQPGSINLFQNGGAPFQLPHPSHQMNNWTSQGLQGMDYPAALSGSLSRYHTNSIYDPMYETIGLPVDPHLRMFTARRNG